MNEPRYKCMNCGHEMRRRFMIPTIAEGGAGFGWVCRSKMNCLRRVHLARKIQAAQ